LGKNKVLDGSGELVK